MKKTFDIKDHGAGLTIILDFRTGMMWAVAAATVVVITAFSAYIVHVYTRWWPPSLGITLLLIATVALFAWIAWRMLGLITGTEVIEVDVTTISITNRNLFRRKKRSFQWGEVNQIFCIRHENFYLSEDKKYLYMADNEEWAHVMVPIMEEGNVMIVTGNSGHLFSGELASWDSEEVITAIEKYSHRKFVRLVEEDMPE